MNYTRRSFTVGAPATREYADNYERIFRQGHDGPVASAEPTRVLVQVEVARLEEWASALALATPEASAMVRDDILDVVEGAK